MYLIEKAESIDQVPNYEEFVKKSGANLFYKKYWMKFHERNEEGVFYFYTRKGKRIESFLALTSDKDGSYYSIPFWFGEEVFMQGNINSYIEEFEKLEGNSVVIGNVSEERAEELEKKGFITYPSFVHPELEISNMEEFWDSLDKNQRKNLKKAKKIAEKETIEIKQVSTEKDLEDYYKLEKETMERKGDKPEPYEFWRDILQTCPKDKILFLLVRKDRIPIAGRISFIGDKRIFNFRGVSSIEFQEYRANELLHLHVIEEAVKRKIRYINYGPDVFSMEGSYPFKKKFANKDKILWEAVYPLTEKSQQETLKNAEEQNKKLRSFLSETRNNGT
ncbi:MAG: GNAT family N-acetyltransferase [Candidatus Pacearchaeota archaeon]